MRIDKLLWCFRYFKTRTLASKACKDGKVTILGNKVKSSREVYSGDKICVRRNQIDYEFLILDIPKSRLGAKLLDVYRKDLTDPETLEAIKMRKSAQQYYREKGEGRPTKKDRRDLDEFFQEDAQDINEQDKNQQSKEEE